MSHSSQESPSARLGGEGSRAGLSRRQIVRAGLSAAPVVAALKSNTVLAGDHTCVKPSTFSSLRAAHMKVSVQREIKTDYECRSHGYWKRHNVGLEKDYKTKTKFISNETGFVTNPGSAFTNKSLQQVLDMGGNQYNTALARHVVAAYLTAVAHRDDPYSVMLTRAQCRKIWNGQGVWQPFAGATWSMSQTMAYFETVYGPAFL